MTLNAFLAWSIYVSCLPFLAIVLILAHYFLRRVMFRRRKRRGLGGLGFYPSAFALGMAFQFLQIFTRPSVAHVLVEKQKEEAEEDGDGDPESSEGKLRFFRRQLKRIRRGDPVDRLVLRV